MKQVIIVFFALGVLLVLAVALFNSRKSDSRSLYSKDRVSSEGGVKLLRREVESWTFFQPIVSGEVFKDVENGLSFIIPQNWVVVSAAKKTPSQYSIRLQSIDHSIDKEASLVVYYRPISEVNIVVGGDDPAKAIEDKTQQRIASGLDSYTVVGKAKLLSGPGFTGWGWKANYMRSGKGFSEHLVRLEGSRTLVIVSLNISVSSERAAYSGFQDVVRSLTSFEL